MAKAKVLVVDDSPTLVKMVTKLFTENGYEVLTAFDGDEALQKAASEKPDLIILDVIMPKRNGFRVCKDIKTLPEYKGIKVILLTTKDQDSDRFWGKKQGADAYIPKPYDDNELLTTAAQLL
jgi:twitching motility two-component system response regulator PilH